MNFRALFKAALLFSAFFVAVALVLAHEFITGAISPRYLGVGLAALLVVSVLAVALLVRTSSVRKAILEPPNNVRSGEYRVKVWATWGGRIAVVALSLAFLNGLWHVGEKPMVPRLVGLGANLLVTFAIVAALRNMERGSK